ncbi:uncharacterized protein LOC116248353 [Nymphaea colorata]|nr:uncharacterized protein LOC116248353 [Nymphaea colorata]
MDLQPEELQHLGPLAILRQAVTIARSSPKHFAALTLVLVFPLSFAILAHSLITHPLLAQLHHRHDSSSGSSPLAALLVFQSLYLLFLFSFSLLSTGAVVYSVACLYTSKSISFSALLSAIPRLLKPLFHTFLWVFFLMFLYYAAFVLCLLLALIFVDNDDDSFSLGIVLVIFFLGVFFGFLHIYIAAIWHLASVISVLEDSYGLAAMKKSRELLKGKMALAGMLVFVYLVACAIIGMIFSNVVVRGGEEYSTGVKFIVGFVLVGLLVLVNLVGLLVQSVFYYVCKAYHHQGIDKSALYDHLGGYLGEYVPLKSSIQMESLDM